MKYTIAVDFDGVLHSSTSPWEAAHIIPDPPVPGAIEWLVSISERFDVVIHTTRARTVRGRRAVREWLLVRAAHLEGLPPGWLTRIRQYKITNQKIPALVYIDDRAWRFDGTTFPTADQIHKARPWNKA